MLYLAHDGSLNGDWISWYAIRFAAHSADKALTLIHIRDEARPQAEFDDRVAHVQRICDEYGVALSVEIHPVRTDACTSLLRALPEGRDTLVVCGARIRPRRKGFLPGTVAERLLRHGAFRVLAMRVVHPGMLGGPRSLLMPVSGTPDAVPTLWAWISLFVPDIDVVHLLRVLELGEWRFRRLSAARAVQLREVGLQSVHDIVDGIRDARGEEAFHLDGHVVVSDDWPKELVIQAGRFKSSLILVRASERLLPTRFLYGHPLEQILREAPCDVGLYRDV